MKNLFTYMMLIVVAVMGFTSCSKDATEDCVEPQTPKTILTVDAEITRTEFGAERNMINWSVGDQFGIYSNNNDQNVASSAYKANEKFTFGVNPFTNDLTLYSYYPYSADNSSSVKINIPAEQTCTAPATLPGANYPLVAKTDVPVGSTNVSFQFQAVGCALALNIFNGAEGETLESVTLETAEETAENCCGEQIIDLAAYDFTKATPTYVGSQKSVVLTATEGAVKLDAKTVADAQNYDNQVYLVVAKKEYHDGATFTIKTNKGPYKFKTKAILKATNDFKVVKIDLTKAAPDVDPNDYWEMYKEGSDITVDGITYKAGDYKYEIVDATTKDVDIRAKLNNNSQKTILFLDTDGTHTCFTSSTTNITSDIVLIGRYKDKKANFQPRMNWKLVSTTDDSPASVSWHNLNIDAGLNYTGVTRNNSYLLNNSGSTADAERWVITGCNLNNINKDRLYQHSAMEYIIKHIVFRDNVFQFNVEESQDKYFFDFKATPRMTDIEEITISNNLIYNKTDKTSWLRILSYTTTTKQNETSQPLKLKLTLENNTFVNMMGRNVYFKMYTALSFVAKDNIFYADPDYFDANASSSCLLYFYCVSPSGKNNLQAIDVCKSYDIQNNIYYGLGSGIKEEKETVLGWNLYNKESTSIPASPSTGNAVKNTQTKLTESPFEVYDAANGVFKPSAAYTQYGVQMQ